MRKKLTHRTLTTLKPPESGILDVWDTELRGFGIRVASNGRKTWFVRYRHAGRKRRLGLGTFPPLSLAAARKEAKTKLSEAELGKDPAGEKAAQRKAPTFGALAELYLEKHASKKKSGREDKRILTVELLPKWRNTHAAEIRRADVIALLDKIAERPAPIMANRTLALARKMFNFGIQRGLVEANPCVLVQRPGQERRRDRVLTEDEIKTLWGELERELKVHGMAAVFKLLLLTAQRRSEVLGMSWPELDLKAGWWTIPGERSKNGLPHRVPLSPQTLRVLESLPQSGHWVFPSPRGDGHITNIQKCVERIRKRARLDWRAHDLRRTAASHMTGAGISRLVVSRILNHHEPGVTAAYDRHSYDPEKRQALELWGRRVEGIVTGRCRRGADVVSMVRQ